MFNLTHCRLLEVRIPALAQPLLDYLRQRGVDARLDADDCGGLNPAMSFVHGTWLVVPMADLERARHLCRYFEEATVVEDVPELREEGE